MTGPRSLRGRVALAAVAGVVAATLLTGALVVGSFAFEARRFAEQPGDADGPPAFFQQRRRFFSDGDPPFDPRPLGRRLGLVGIGTLALVGGAAYVLSGVALRPLAGLRESAGRVSGTNDLATRLPHGDGPEEVDALAGSLNGMLARLERSTEGLRRFAADAGHELRTPLTSMQTNLEVLRNPQLGGAERQRVLDDVIREHQRLVRLVDALQLLARGEAAGAVVRERVDLADVVDAAVSDARRRHPRARVDFADPGEVAVRGWAEGLRVAVDNLLENALRHGPPAGPVTVALKSAGASVRLTVEDRGPGVDPADRERVFGRFARGRNARAPGSGLGLALVKQQADLHHGHVAVDDAPGGGARFLLTLPAR